MWWISDEYTSCIGVSTIYSVKVQQILSPCTGGHEARIINPSVANVMTLLIINRSFCLPTASSTSFIEVCGTAPGLQRLWRPSKFLLHITQNIPTHLSLVQSLHPYNPIYTTCHPLILYCCPWTESSSGRNVDREVGLSLIHISPHSILHLVALCYFVSL